MLDIDKLSAFIASVPNADTIVRLARHQNSSEDFLSPDFELIDDGEDASLAWFDSDAVTAARFVPFGQSSDGGLFTFWMIDGSCPIVYLNAECEGSSVVARNVDELLALLAYGSDNYAVDIAYSEIHDEEWAGPGDVPETLDDFRDWLHSEFGVQLAGSPLAAIKAAAAESPDLMDWIQCWQESRYGTDNT